MQGLCFGAVCWGCLVGMLFVLAVRAYAPHDADDLTQFKSIWNGHVRYGIVVQAECLVAYHAVEVHVLVIVHASCMVAVAQFILYAAASVFDGVDELVETEERERAGDA